MTPWLPKRRSSTRALWSYRGRHARDKGGLMSPLVSTFIDSDQAGLEDSDAGLRVTHAHFCPTLLRFVLPGQQLPGGGLHVTSPPKPAPQRTPWPQGEAWLRAHPRAVARDTPPAADARRRGNPEVLSRVERERCAGDAPRHTPPSNSVGSLPPIDGGGTTCGTIGTGSEPFSPSPECGRPGWVYFREQTRVNTGECLRPSRYSYHEHRRPHALAGDP